MDLQSSIEAYGYWAVLIGTILEGETVLVLAGFAAHRGYLELAWVIIVATIGSLLGDQLWYFLGRRYGDALIGKMPQLRPAVERVRAKIAKHERGLVFSVRFLYGMRIAGPIAIGMSRVPPATFLAFNLLGALAWATLFAAGGYVFGQTLEAALGDLGRHEAWIFAALVIAGALWWLSHSLRRRTSTSTQPEARKP